MKTRRTSGLYLVFGVLTAVGVGGLLAGRTMASARGYVPADDAPRLSGSVSEIAGLGAVADFDWLGDALYVLDALEHAVTVLRADDSGAWRVAQRFGRYGGGPGELLRPTGIARLIEPPRIAVVDQARLHLFDTAGVYLESLPVDVTCGLPLPRVSAGLRGVFIHGDCLQRAAGGDTIFAMLFWSRDGHGYQEVARDARYSPDGSFGTIYGARHSFTSGTSHHLFGSGVSNCLWRVTDTIEPAAVKSCDVQTDELPFVVSDASRERLDRRATSAATRPPASFAWYDERIPGPPDLLLRIFHEDSLVLRELGGTTDLAVLTLDGFVGCRSGGCLFAESTDAGVRLRALPSAALHALVGPRDDQ